MRTYLAGAIQLAKPILAGMRNSSLALAILLVLAQAARAQPLDSLPEVLRGDYVVARDVPYVAQDEPSAYRRERAVADLYYPRIEAPNTPLVVWIHGGGLTGGAKHLPDGLREQGMAVMSISYRLSPRATVSEIIDDAAAAVAWGIEHAGVYGADSRAVWVTGHSAGGYLASMIAMDSTRLAAFDHHPAELAGVAPLSGHTVTHFTERAGQGIPGERIVADSLAPIFYVRAGRTPPLLLITGDRDLELLGRYEENAFFWRMLRVAGNERVTLHELEGYGHGIIEPAVPLVSQWIRDSVGGR